MEIKKRTKIVATLGPASDKCETILAMARAGVNVFRLNFSHGSLENKKKLVDIIRDINARYQMQLAILADLQGPKLRIGHLDPPKVLKTGDELCFSDKSPEGQEHILVSYKDLAKDIKVGNKILLDDGKISVVVKAIVGDKIITEVLQGGVLSSNKGFNLPDTHTSLPPLTEKDRTDLSFILSESLEWVALSFVRSVKDVILLKNLIKQKGALTKVIAKIEKPEAVTCMRDIIDVSDGIMIARGDLGVEMPIETVPLIQKDIIFQCICKAKSVIVATQMMESMIENSQPNRSEITDVANAVIDGTDAVMLSGETAVGQYPVLVVETVAKIIKEIERKGYPKDRSEVLKPRSESSTFYSDAIAYNTCKIAGDIGADMILGMTQSGLTGFTLSAYRSPVPLYVSAPTPLLVNQLMLSWGVQSFLCPSLDDVDKNIETPIDILKRKGVLKKGDVVVSTASIPVKDKLPTNMLKIHQVK